MTRQGASLRWPAASTLLAGSALIPAALPSTARAQDIPADDTGLVLDTIVVTAAGFQQNVTEAPATISVVPGEQLRQEMVRDLGDALRAVPGVVTAGNANEGEISIRGLPGTYTLILLDGVRQGTRDSRPNGSGGIEQNFMPPPEAIDRIEVLRGPASTLYGSDAVGGVINITTAFRPGVKLKRAGGQSESLPVLVTIADNGPGIPEALIRDVFDPFVSSKVNGTGLGLSLVSKLISDHGGVVECDSRPGRTRFHIRLPLWRGAVEDLEG